jgi:hypothetical protein
MTSTYNRCRTIKCTEVASKAFAVSTPIPRDIDDFDRSVIEPNAPMIRKITKYVTSQWRAMLGESAIPAPPFKASKRTATIMYGLWYGRMTPNHARKLARDWGYSEDQVEDMITDATAEPSYWSQYSPADGDEVPCRN